MARIGGLHLWEWDDRDDPGKRRWMWYDWKEATVSHRDRVIEAWVCIVSGIMIGMAIAFILSGKCHAQERWPDGIVIEEAVPTDTLPDAKVEEMEESILPIYRDPIDASRGEGYDIQGKPHEGRIAWLSMKRLLSLWKEWKDSCDVCVDTTIERVRWELHNSPIFAYMGGPEGEAERRCGRDSFTAFMAFMERRYKP